VTGPWTPEPFEADDGTVPYERFIATLSDFKFIALEAAIDQVLSVRGIELARTEWLKALGQGLHEFRVRHDAEETCHMFGGNPSVADGPNEKVLLRLFVHFHGTKVVLLLGGYDKGADPKPRRQQREIAEARRLLAQFKARQRREQTLVRRTKHRRRS